MDARSEETRGEDARRIIEAPIYKESYAIVDAKIVNELGHRDVAPERKRQLCDLLTMGRLYRQYLEQVIVTGTMAGMELERQKTLRERFLGRNRRA